MAAYPTWRYYKILVITGTAAGAQSNYPVKVTVTHVTGNMNADFSDIRFTDSSGDTELKYWIESYTASTSAVVWVKVTTIPASPSTATIYLYYGKSTASDASDPDNVFSFFDGFDGASLNGAKWTQGGTGGSVAVSGGTLQLVLSNERKEVYVTTDDKEEFGPGKSVRARWKFGDTQAADIARHIALGDTAAWIYTTDYIGNYKYGSINNAVYVCNESVCESESMAAGQSAIDTWYVVELMLFIGGDHAKVTVNDTDFTKEWSGESDVPDDTDLFLFIYLRSIATARTATDECDWILVRTLADPEPTVGSWSSEYSNVFGDTRCRIAVVPIEELADNDGNVYSRLSGEVNTKLRGSMIVVEAKVDLTGSEHGYEDAAPYYIEALVNGGGAFTTVSAAKLIHLKNTGHEYDDSTAFGDPVAEAIKIIVAGATLAILDAGEPLMFKDNNGGIDASGITVETVETDGSTIASGTGLALEFLVLE